MKKILSEEELFSIASMRRKSGDIYGAMICYSYLSRFAISRWGDYAKFIIRDYEFEVRDDDIIKFFYDEGYEVKKSFSTGLHNVWDRGILGLGWLECLGICVATFIVFQSFLASVIYETGILRSLVQSLIWIFGVGYILYARRR